MNRLLVLVFASCTALAVSAADWQADVTGLAIPGEPAGGMVHGAAFQVEKAQLNGGILHLRQGKEFFADQEFVIFLFLQSGESVSGKHYSVNSESGFGSPHIHMKYRVEGKNIPETDIFMKDYTMKLEFGKAVGKSVPAKIYLCAPDKEKSFVAGSFTAAME